MVTSRTMRHYYPELVVGGVDAVWNVEGVRPRCDYTSTVKVGFYAAGPSYRDGAVELRVHPAVADWTRALAAVMLKYRYAFRETAGGSLACRTITNGKKTSLHAHGVAIDFNPSKNRYRHQARPIQWGRQTDMTKAMIDDILGRIVTVDGRKVTRWGGRWTNTKDPMHFEASGVTRTQLEKGIDFNLVPGWDDYQRWIGGDVEMNVLRVGHKGNAVVKLQRALNQWQPTFPLVPDGIFGAKTGGKVIAYQEAAQLPDVTGEVDGVTMALLMEYLADFGGGGPWATKDHGHAATAETTVTID